MGPVSACGILYQEPTFHFVLRYKNSLETVLVRGRKDERVQREDVSDALGIGTMLETGSERLLPLQGREQPVRKVAVSCLVLQQGWKKEAVLSTQPERTRLQFFKWERAFLCLYVSACKEVRAWNHHDC